MSPHNFYANSLSKMNKQVAAGLYLHAQHDLMYSYCFGVRPK